MTLDSSDVLPKSYHIFFAKRILKCIFLNNFGATASVSLLKLVLTNKLQSCLCRHLVVAAVRCLANSLWNLLMSFM